MGFTIGDTYKAYAPMRPTFECLGELRTPVKITADNPLVIGPATYSYSGVDVVEPDTVVVLYKENKVLRVGRRAVLANAYYGELTEAQRKALEAEATRKAEDEVSSRPSQKRIE